MLEAAKVAQYPFSPSQPIQDLDWELYLQVELQYMFVFYNCLLPLQETAKQIVSEQSPRKLAEIRARLYELITHCIPPDVIFVGLQKELVIDSFKCLIFSF